MQVLEYLKTAVSDGASDVFIIAGGYISEKTDKRMRNISEERVFPETSETLTVRIRPASASGDASADLTLVFNGVDEQTTSIESISVATADNKTYGCNETIRIKVVFSDRVSSISFSE